MLVLPALFAPNSAAVGANRICRASAGLLKLLTLSRLRMAVRNSRSRLASCESDAGLTATAADDATQTEAEVNNGIGGHRAARRRWRLAQRETRSGSGRTGRSPQS